MILQQTENQVYLKCSASEKRIVDWRGYDLFGVSMAHPLMIKVFIYLSISEDFACLISFNCFRAKMSSWHGVQGMCIPLCQNLPELEYQ